MCIRSCSLIFASSCLSCILLSEYLESRHFFIFFLSILFTFPAEMRVENAHFCLITCILLLSFLPSEELKSALEATFSALLVIFSVK